MTVKASDITTGEIIIEMRPVGSVVRVAAVDVADEYQDAFGTYRPPRRHAS